jgi:hypothetical protein
MLKDVIEINIYIRKKSLPIKILIQKFNFILLLSLFNRHNPYNYQKLNFDPKV